MDKSLFLAEVLPFKDKLFRIAKRLLVSAEEAEDAVQEVLLKLWNGRDKMKNYRSVEAFAITMTKNYCLDRLKSKQASQLQIVHSNYAATDNVEKGLEISEEVGMVFKIMERLPPNQKLVLQLRDVEQFEFAEIAKIMESNETAIRVSLSRARKTIREEILKQYRYGLKKY